MKFIGIIPARYASTRFPGKPLALIGSKSMINRVFEQASKFTAFSRVVVATDNDEIFNHVKAFGDVLITSPQHQSGTDRCCEAAQLLSGEFPIDDSDVIINIQGDEPFVLPEQIASLARLFENENVEIGTLVKKITDTETLWNENIVKAVFGSSGNALYFSRMPIPFLRSVPKEKWLKHYQFFSHLGMYAYRYGVLKRIASLPIGHLETAESLEQLRWLENGLTIHVAQTTIQSLAIDTPEDLSQIAHLIKD